MFTVIIQVTIRSIECRRTAFTEIRTGQSATLCVKPINRKIVLKKSYFRKGMVVISGIENVGKGVDPTPQSIRFVILIGLFLKIISFSDFI